MFLGWLPLLILMVYIFFFNLGYGAMIWITVVEILPLHVRSVATSLSVGFTCAWSFVTSHTYKYLKDLFDYDGIFWFYGTISFLGFLFIVIFVPETKGKSDAQIREYFQNSKKTRKIVTKNSKVPNATKINWWRLSLWLVIIIICAFYFDEKSWLVKKHTELLQKSFLIL